MKASSGSGEWPKVKVRSGMPNIQKQPPRNWKRKAKADRGCVHEPAAATSEKHGSRAGAAHTAAGRHLYSATISTEFLPPYGFCVVSLALGSGTHWPSTTKRYSCRPGGTANSPFQRP